MNPTDTPAVKPRGDDTMPGKTDQDPSKPDEVKVAPKTNPGASNPEDVA